MTKVSRRNGTTTRLLRGTRFFVRDERGAVAVIFALMLFVLAGCLALVFDLGRMWNLDTELQTAVDAGALAGATQLDGSDGARLRAAQAAASAMARNQQRYASIDGAGDVTYSTAFQCTDPVNCVMTNENFRFFSNLKNRTDATCDGGCAEPARYIEVTVRRTVGFSFAALTGAVTEASPVARAVSGWDRFICGNIPLITCNPSEPPGNTDKSYPFYVDGIGPGGTKVGPDYRGRGVTLKEKGGGAQLIPGEFAWLAVVVCGIDGDADNCETQKGAKALGEALAQVNPPDACIGNTVELQTGTITDAGRMINQRLDIYPPNGPDANADDEEYQPSANFLTGLVKEDPTNPNCDFNVTGQGGSALRRLEDLGRPYYRGMFADANNVDLNLDGSPQDALHDIGGGPYPAPYSFNPSMDHLGYPRDACAYRDNSPTPMPVAQDEDVDGDPYPEGSGSGSHCIYAPPPSWSVSPGEQVGTGIWDFFTYMAYHHPKKYSDLAGSFNPFNCGVTCEADSGIQDLDGNERISRFEVYSWELANLPAEAPEYNRDMCSTVEPPTLPFEPGVSKDRRLIGVAVMNCEAIAAANECKGNKPCTLAEGDPAINVFLSEALGELTENAMYGEIVGPQGLGGNGPAIVITDRIILYE